MAASALYLTLLVLVVWSSITSILSAQFESRSTCGLLPENWNDDNNYDTYPWVIKIMDQDYNILTAGSLIADNVVLTSAQFVDRETPSTIRIQAGSGEQSTVRKILIHEDYYNDKRNNVALIFLQRRLQLGENCRTACLFLKFSRQRCISYRLALFASGRADVDEFEFPLMTPDRCQKVARDQEIWWDSDYSSPTTYVCSSGESNPEQCKKMRNYRGTGVFCPLVGSDNDDSWRRNTRYVQVGIASWARDCQRNYGVYTNISYYSSWIRSAISNN